MMLEEGFDNGDEKTDDGELNIDEPVLEYEGELTGDKGLLNEKDGGDFLLTDERLLISDDIEVNRLLIDLDELGMLIFSDLYCEYDGI